MPDHAGDRGAVFLVLAPRDHLHIKHERMYFKIVKDRCMSLPWPTRQRTSISALVSLCKPDGHLKRLASSTTWGGHEVDLPGDYLTRLASWFVLRLQEQAGEGHIAVRSQCRVSVAYLLGARVAVQHWVLDCTG